MPYFVGVESPDEGRSLSKAKFEAILEANGKQKYRNNSILDSISYDINFDKYKNYLIGHVNTIKNKLQFKLSQLNGVCTITQFDRILRCLYKYGYLEGTQIVFTKDNKIHFIGNYKRSKLNGKFIIISHFKLVWN